ncbi:MAG: carboxymuconolactone decarboxylase family protein [Phycisphaerae bacterium]|jgi:alkylhydroperoxidase/carboxymuconolactone decarboxylase family protein YurZ
MKKMQKDAPAMTAGFGTLFSKVMTDGAISLREKELIALSIAVGIQCSPCIRAHVKKCLETGSSKEQIPETAAVAVVMGVGPAYMHAAVEVMDALEALGK